MSAYREITIRCDGPGCASSVHTRQPTATKARAEMRKLRWHALADGARVHSWDVLRDFCTEQCANQYARLHITPRAGER